jgi:TonB family protein
MNSKWFVILIMAVLVAGVPRAAASAGAKAKDEAKQAKDSAPQRVRVGNNAMAAKRVHTVNPKYPKEAKKKHIEGTVRLEAVIGKDGKVKDLKVISGDPALTDSALEAVKKWRYKPVKIKGEPVELETEIDVKFTL